MHITLRHDNNIAQPNYVSNILRNCFFVNVYVSFLTKKLTFLTQVNFFAYFCSRNQEEIFRITCYIDTKD